MGGSISWFRFRQTSWRVFRSFWIGNPFTSNISHITKNGFGFTGIFATNIIIRSRNMKASVLLSKNSVRKKQKDYQIRQTSDSVSLYHEIVKERSSDTRPATDRKNTSVGKPEISPRNDTNVFTAPPEKCSNSVQAGPAEYSRSSKRVIRDSTPRAESPPAKMSRNTCQEADQKPSGFYDKTVCNKMQKSDQPVKIGTSWKSAFSGLRDEIMVLSQDIEKLFNVAAQVSDLHKIQIFGIDQRRELQGFSDISRRGKEVRSPLDFDPEDSWFVPASYSQPGWAGTLEV